MKYILIVFVSLVFLGCSQSGHDLYYKSASEHKLAYIKNSPDANFLKDKEEPTIVHTDEDNFRKTHDELTRESYVLLGVSAFIEPLENESNAIQQAKKVGATKILLLIKPFIQNPNKYEQYANFYIKLNSDKFGTRFNVNITDEERNKFGKSGVRIKYILNGTLAHKSELRENDIVTNINGFDIKDTQQFKNILEEVLNDKKPFSFKVIRDEKELTINFTNSETNQTKTF